MNFRYLDYFNKWEKNSIITSGSSSSSRYESHNSVKESSTPDGKPKSKTSSEPVVVLEPLQVDANYFVTIVISLVERGGGG